MFYALLSVILPTFGVIAVGVLARRLGIWKESAVEVLNKYAYYIALPALIFLSIVSFPLEAFLNPQTLKMIGGALFIHAALALVIVLVGIVGGLSRATQATSAMLMTFGSTAYMGIPFVAYLVGGNATAYASLLSVALVVTLIVLHTLLLNRADRSSSAKSNMISFLELPFVWAVVLGMGWLLLNLPPVPTPLYRFLDVLAGSAGPTALLGIGAFLFRIRPAQIPWGTSSLAALVKVLVLPLLVFITLRWIGLEDILVVVATSLAAVGTAVTCFVMAEEHHVGTKETAGTILLSTILSLLTLSVISYVWLTRI